MTDQCTRCEKHDALVVPIFKVRGHTLPSLTPNVEDSFRQEFTCAQCITDDELARMLYPVVDFVLGTLPRNPEHPEHAVAIETVHAYFKVYNLNGNERSRTASLRAVGLLEL